MPALTPRQRQVAELIADGLSYAEIGERLGIKHQTIRNTVEAICQRTGAHGRVEIAVRVNRDRMISSFRRYDPATHVCVPIDVWETMCRHVTGRFEGEGGEP